MKKIEKLEIKYEEISHGNNLFQRVPVPLNFNDVVGKLNEIIDVINALTTKDK